VPALEYLVVGVIEVEEARLWKEDQEHQRSRLASPHDLTATGRRAGQSRQSERRGADSASATLGPPLTLYTSRRAISPPTFG
jgi:hypothetical protein